MPETMVEGVIVSTREAVATPSSVSGYKVRPFLLAPDKTHAVAGSEHLYLVAGPITMAAATARQQAAVADPAVTDAGLIPLRSHDPSLRSCNDQLQDKPRAAALIAPVSEAIVASGLTTAAVLQAPGTTWAVTDNPLDPNELIVTAGVQGKPESPQASGAPATYPTQAITAFVDKASSKVLTVGFSPIYDEAAQQ
jgi:hypothetical protein